MKIDFSIRTILFRLFLGLTIFHLSTQTYAENFDHTEEIEKYKAVFNTEDYKAIIKHSKKLIHSGMSDESLFDIVNSKLLKSDPYSTGSQSKKYGLVSRSDYIIHMIKALASSGSDKYTETFNRIIKQSRVIKFQTHAKYQRDKITWYKKRNALMQSMDNHEEGKKPLISMFINLLKCNDHIMQKYAAEQIFYQYFKEPRVYDALANQLLIDYKKGKTITYIDQIAWYCKTLGLSKNPAHKAVLKTVIDAKVNPKVTRFAKKAYKGKIKRLRRPRN